MGTRKYRYRKRVFLNQDQELSAFLIASVPIDKGFRCYPTLDISDCSNKISLDFSFYSPDDAKKTKKKIKLFRDIVNAFADALEAEIAEKEKQGVPKRKKVKRETLSLLEDEDDD